MDAHIVAVAGRTPVGWSAEASAAAVRAGIGRVADHPLFLDMAGEPLRCARDSALPAELPGAARVAALARAAFEEVLAKLGAMGLRSTDIHVLFALADPHPGFGPRESAAVLRALEEVSPPDGVRAQIEVVGGGHAGGLRALDAAMQRLADRRDDVCVVGGADSFLDRETLAALDDGRRLARQDVRSGFVPGEGAGAVVLMSRAARAHYRALSLARVRSVAVAYEPRSIDADEGLLGDGLTDVVRRALADLRPGECIDDVYCDINGERHRTDEWGFVLQRIPSGFRDGTMYETGVGSWGDVGAASAPLSCVRAVQAWRRGYARGPRALVWASSPAGLRGASFLEV